MRSCLVDWKWKEVLLIREVGQSDVTRAPVPETSHSPWSDECGVGTASTTSLQVTKPLARHRQAQRPYKSQNLSPDTGKHNVLTSHKTSRQTQASTTSYKSWARGILVYYGDTLHDNWKIKNKTMSVANNFKVFKHHVSRSNVYTWRCVHKTCPAKVYTQGETELTEHH
jgi:hypothetical protein